MKSRGTARLDGFTSSSIGSSSSRSERLERLLEGDNVGRARTSGVLCGWKKIGESSAGMATGAYGSARIAVGKVGAVGEALGLRGAFRRAYAEIGCRVSPVQLLWLPERERDARELARIGPVRPAA